MPPTSWRSRYRRSSPRARDRPRFVGPPVRGTYASHLSRLRKPDVPAIAHHTTHLSADVVAPAEARAALGAAVEAPIAEDVLRDGSAPRHRARDEQRSTRDRAARLRRPRRDRHRRGRLQVEVHDSGVGTADLRPEERPDGGYGLQLVDQLADRWGSVHSGEGTCVWFELLLAPTSAESAAASRSDSQRSSGN